MVMYRPDVFVAGLENQEGAINNRQQKEQIDPTEVARVELVIIDKGLQNRLDALVLYLQAYQQHLQKDKTGNLLKSDILPDNFIDCIRTLVISTGTTPAVIQRIVWDKVNAAQ